MKIFPAVHYTMGGLWVGFAKDPKSGGLKAGDPSNLMTNIPGLYSMGEANFTYHGAEKQSPGPCKVYENWYNYHLPLAGRSKC